MIRATKHVCSHSTATTSPHCTFRSFASWLGELQVPLVAIEEGVASLNNDDIIVQKTNSSGRLPYVIGHGG